MSPSWNKLLLAERYLLGRSSPGERCLVEARRCLDRDFEEDLQAQKRTYRLIRQYGRKQLRKEIEAVQRQLFSEPRHAGFREKIARLFS